MLVSRPAPLAAIMLALAACSGRPPERAAPPPDKPAVYVVNYPLEYFAARIGGDRISVRFPAPADVDPAYWKPDPDVIAAYQNAGLILLNGASYAKWVETASLPLAKTVDTSAGFKDRYIQMASAVTHSHGPAGQHAHGGTAFTTWLDPQLAILQAEAVAAALKKLLPRHAAAFHSGFTALKEDLQSLDASFRQALNSYRGAPLLASHPVYQYLARAYGLNLESVHWEPEQMPSAEQWRELDTLLKRHPAKWMIWEGPPAAAVAAELRRRGINSVVFDTCGNVPETGDYLSVMKENAERLRLLR